MKINNKDSILQYGNSPFINKDRSVPERFFFLFPWWQFMHNSRIFNACLCRYCYEVLHIMKWSHWLCKQRQEPTERLWFLLPSGRICRTAEVSMCVRGQNLPASDFHVAPEPEQNPQFVLSASDHHIAPDTRCSNSENMCNTLQHIILDHTYCWILHPPLTFIISPLDN